MAVTRKSVFTIFAVVLLPFLLALALTHLQYLIPAELHYAEFSPMYIMGANGFYYELPGVVLAEIGIPLALSLILAAVITPSSDPFTLTVVFIPIYILWEISAFLVKPAPKEDSTDVQPA